VRLHAFVLVLTCGAALLALWILARFTSFGPRSIPVAVVHVVVAMVLLKLALPPALDAVGSLPAAPYVKVFGVALPLFVYAFLSGGWVTRLAIGQMH
jgi:hypothetical protein